MAIIGIVNPEWTDFIPTIACETGSLTVAQSGIRYRQIGSFVIANGSVTITNAGSGGGYIAVSLPFPPAYIQNGCGHMFNPGGADGVMLTVGTIPYGVGLWKYDGTTAITAPMVYTFSILYEKAL
jgi:hypothetical protein